MFFSSPKKKIISSLLIISFFAVNLLPICITKAEAQVANTPTPPVAIPTGGAAIDGFPVSDTLVQLNTSFLVTNTYSIASILSGVAPGQKQDSWKASLLMLVLKRVLREITKSIVTWINSGFNGNPSFITNTGQFLQNTADITIIP